ncbi:MAG: GNAT family N-acetyltransferase [Methyloligellaceae bacterium]
MVILTTMDIHCTSIRAASPLDAPSLAETLEAAWRYAYTGMLPCLDLERYIARRGSLWWRNFLKKDPDILVLNFDNNLIGYASIGENENHKLPYHGEIMELYIHPDYHGLGFGSKLFRMARKQLKSYGFRGMLLWTLEDNHSAIDFYRHMGGQIVATEEGQFGQSQVNKIGFGWEN